MSSAWVAVLRPRYLRRKQWTSQNMFKKKKMMVVSATIYRALRIFNTVTSACHFSLESDWAHLILSPSWSSLASTTQNMSNRNASSAALLEAEFRHRTHWY